MPKGSHPEFTAWRVKRLDPVLREAGLGQTHPLDSRGSQEVPTGTCQTILKAAGIRSGGAKVKQT